MPGELVSVPSNSLGICRNQSAELHLHIRQSVLWGMKDAKAALLQDLSVPSVDMCKGTLAQQALCGGLVLSVCSTQSCGEHPGLPVAECQR